MTPAICVRVLGIGSPFGDDRLGWDAVTLLSQHPLLNDNGTSQFSDPSRDVARAQAITLQKQDSPRWQAQICDRPGLQLLHHIQGATTVFLVDALYSLQRPAGSVCCVSSEEIFTQQEGVEVLCSSHGVGVLQALELGRVLGYLPVNLRIFGIVTHSQDTFAQALSTPVAEALPRLVDKLAMEVYQAI